MSVLTTVVLIKQVPDMDKVEFDYKEGRIDRSSADLESNPFDLNALEEAVRFKEQLGGEIIAISMGPKQAESTLREALARGVDRAILLSDRNFAGSDTWATSTALGLAIKKLPRFDLIVCGEKTVDGDTGQVGPEVAEFLGLPHVCFASKIKERAESYLKLEAQAWGTRFVKKMRLPGLITVTKDVNTPRLPSFKDKLKAKKAEIGIWEADDITENASIFGIKGSPTRVVDTEIPPPQKREGIIIRDEPAQAVKKLLAKLDIEVRTG